MTSKVLILAFALLCGASAAPERGSRIAGGAPVPVQEAPYAVALVYYYPRPQIYIQRCVGALISSWHVLTTAHCYYGAVLSNMQVRAGSTFSLSGGQVVGVREAILHPAYQASPRLYDIGVTELKAPLGITASINTLYLPPPGYSIPDGTEFKVVGWGFESQTGTTQLDSLQAISLFKVNSDQCKATYEDVEDVAIEDSVLCAANGPLGTCRGDSGAPLVRNNVLLGISSRQECGSAYPDVFTRVDRFTDWIMEVAKAPSGMPVKLALEM